MLGSQGLWPGRRFTGGPAGIRQAIRQAGLIQMDPLTVIARSHDLALHARVIDYRPEDLDRLMYVERQAFDYGGTVYVLPMEELPYWRVSMSRRRNDPRWAAFATQHDDLLTAVRQQLRQRGPLGARDFAGTGKAVSFRSTKDSSLALYYLWLTGELMTHSRRNFERIYYFREDVAPAEYQAAATEAEAETFFATKALALIGLVSGRDWARRFSKFVHRSIDRAEARQRLAAMVDAGVAAPVRVTGSKDLHYVATDAVPRLEEVNAGGVPAQWRPVGADTNREVTLLAPLELVSARGRALELFGFEYLWEVYKPAEQRRWGYYTLPILYGDQLVARIDPKLDRARKTIVVNGFWLEETTSWRDEAFLDALAAGLRRLAAMVGAVNLDLRGVNPPQFRTALRRRTAGGPPA